MVNAYMSVTELIDLKIEPNVDASELTRRLEELALVHREINSELWENVRDDLQIFLLEGCKQAAEYTKDKKKKEKEEASRIFDLIIKLLEHGYGHQLMEMVISIVSKEGTLLHYEPVLVLIAVCCVFGEKEVRRRSYGSMSQICFNSPRLFFFIAVSESLEERKKKLNGKPKRKPWGSMHRRAISQFYLDDRGPLYVLFNTTKCKRRYKMTHRSVLGKCRPKPKGPDKDSYDLVFCYLTRGYDRTKKKYEGMNGKFSPSHSTLVCTLWFGYSFEGGVKNRGTEKSWEVFQENFCIRLECIILYFNENK